MAGGNVPQVVKLGHLMVVFAAYLLIRNQPGLLEVILLSRLQLRQDTTYAIPPTLNYLIPSVTSHKSLGVY